MVGVYLAPIFAHRVDGIPCERFILAFKLLVRILVPKAALEHRVNFRGFVILSSANLSVILIATRKVEAIPHVLNRRLN